MYQHADIVVKIVMIGLILASTLATHDRDSVSVAISMAVDAYINLRADALPENIADDATRWAVLAMLKKVSDQG